MKEHDVLNVAIVGGGPGCKAIMDMIFAERLSQLRMRLIGVADINPAAAGGVAERIGSESGGRAVAIGVDVTDEAQVEELIDRTVDELGRIDIVVSNASAGAGMGEKAWQANFDVDVMSAARLLDAARPALAESEAGSAVLISSTAAVEFLGVPQPYNAMKAALIALANDQSQALAGQGVRVNTVSPGPMRRFRSRRISRSVPG